MSNMLSEELPDYLRDRDIFRDHQSRLFVVLGFIQPTKRVLSYLKYIPDRAGTWKTKDLQYRRIFWGSVDSAVEGLAVLPERYVNLDNHFGTSLVEPPHDVIAEWYSPERRLSEVLESAADSLEELTKQAAEFLHDEIGVPFDKLGVAGSILWKGHSPTRSDVNMNIYGFRTAWSLAEKYEGITSFRDQARLRGLPEWKHAIKRVGDRVPVLGQYDLQALFARRNALCIRDRCIGITPVLYPDEAPIIHGTESYTTQNYEPIRFRATIENVDYGIFHPAIYGITPIAHNENTINRIMVYDGAFGGLFKTDDSVEVSGTLQKVTTPKNETGFYQIMVGTKTGSGREYIRLV
jgi:predicted nucleotidyltransferase